jgi:hypothetical protein
MVAVFVTVDTRFLSNALMFTASITSTALVMRKSALIVTRAIIEEELFFIQGFRLMNRVYSY